MSRPITEVPDYEAPRGKRLVRYGDIPPGTRYWIPGNASTKRRGQTSLVEDADLAVLVDVVPPFDFARWRAQHAFLGGYDEGRTGKPRYVAQWDAIQPVVDHLLVRTSRARPVDHPQVWEVLHRDWNFAPDAILEVKPRLNPEDEDG